MCDALSIIAEANLQPSYQFYSRREFLQQGSAAIAAGYALQGFWRRSLAADAAPAPASASGSVPTEGARQGIACLRREAADAARDALEQGGNAVDAAVAALLVLFVIEPAMVGLGGYGGSFVIYHAKSGRVRSIDSTSRAPRKFDAAMFNVKSATHGYLAIGVPGNVAGIDQALREFGTMPFRKLAAHAIDLAENGTVVTPRLARQFNGLLADIDSISHRAYFPQGVPAEGALWKQPDLARLMRRLGDEGPSSFYSSDTAAVICKQVQANGGVLAEDDFREFHATTVEPLHINYRGVDLYTPPLPAGGLTCLSILKTLEQVDLPQYTPWGAPYFDLFARASQLAWRERARYFGDPEFVKTPIEELLSEQHAKAAAAEVRKRAVVATPARAIDASHTVNVVVADREQNVVSWTATHGNDFGSHVAIEGLGLMLGHGMSRFSVDKSSPNFPAPRKRPQHNMSPIVALKNGKPYAALGMPGGTRIVSVTTQLVVNLIDFEATPQSVVSAPRIHIEDAEPIGASSGVRANVIEELKKLGHQVESVGEIGGGANAVVLDSKTGQLTTAASKNSDGVLAF